MCIRDRNSWEPGCAQCYLPRQGMAQFVYGSGPDLSFADNNGRDYYFNDSEVT